MQKISRLRWCLGWLALMVALAMAAPISLPVARAAGPEGTVVIQSVSGGPIWVSDGEGGVRYLTDGIDPALSPDGRQVAFTRWDSPSIGTLGALWVINVDGSGERPIAGELHQPKAPIWSPDGSRIVLTLQTRHRPQPEFKCTRDLPNEPLQGDEDGDKIKVVVKVDRDGDVEILFCYTVLARPFWGLGSVTLADGVVTALPHDLFSYAGDWDPVNPWRLVYRGDAGLVSLDINQGTRWALTDDRYDRAPTFSPDGRFIAVTYWQHDHWEVHRLNADGSGRVRLTETTLTQLADQRLAGLEPRSYHNAAPAWSPDGRRIAFVTDRTGRWEVWVMNADGGDPQPLFGPEVQAQLSLQYFGVDERMISWR